VYIHTDHSQLLGQVCSALLPHKTPPSKRLFCRLRYCSFDKRERPHALSSLRFAPGACPPHGLLTLGRIRCSLFAYLTLHTQSRLSHRQQRTLVLLLTPRDRRRAKGLSLFAAWTMRLQRQTHTQSATATDVPRSLTTVPSKSQK
jgi:hypothetical protein